MLVGVAEQISRIVVARDLETTFRARTSSERCLTLMVFNSAEHMELFSVHPVMAEATMYGGEQLETLGAKFGFLAVGAMQAGAAGVTVAMLWTNPEHTSCLRAVTWLDNKDDVTVEHLRNVKEINERILPYMAQPPYAVCEYLTTVVQRHASENGNELSATDMNVYFVNYTINFDRLDHDDFMHIDSLEHASYTDVMANSQTLTSADDPLVKSLQCLRKDMPLDQFMILSACEMNQRHAPAAWHVTRPAVRQ